MTKKKRTVLLEELFEKYNIKSGKRFEYSQKQAWFLTKHQRVAVIRIEKYLRSIKSTTITDIYDIEDLKILWPNDKIRRAWVQFAIMFFKTFHRVTVKCNNGYKIIAWNRAKERRIKRKRRKKHEKNNQT